MAGYSMVVKPPHRNQVEGGGRGFKASLKPNLTEGAKLGGALLLVNWLQNQLAQPGGFLGSLVTPGSSLQPFVGPAVGYAIGHFIGAKGGRFGGFGQTLQEASVACAVLSVGNMVGAPSVSNQQGIPALKFNMFGAIDMRRIGTAATARSTQLAVRNAAGMGQATGMGAIDTRRLAMSRQGY